MIRPTILLSALDSDHVPDGFYYANDLLFSHTVGADGTYITISHIETALAEFNFTTHLADHLAELYYIIVILFEEMQDQPQGGFFADAWKFSKFVNRIFEK